MAVILVRAPEIESDANNPVRVCQCIPMIPDQTGFEARFGMKLVTRHGQTETSLVTFDNVENARPGSCGLPHPDWEISVVDERDMPVPQGTVGEILARPKKNWRLFSGYHWNTPKTVEVTRKLWYHSGDAGYLDKDGWLYFKHRLGDASRRHHTETRGAV